jgi:hypothetical protein
MDTLGKDPFQNIEKRYWLYALPIAIPFYSVIYYPVHLFAGFVFSGMGASNSTLWSLAHFSIRIVSFICTSNKIYYSETILIIR